MLDFVIADKKLEPGGLLGFHDMWMPALKKIVRYILTNRGYQLVTPPSTRLPKLSIQEKSRSLVASCLRRLPRANQIFTQNILYPEHQLWRSNMVFLRKNREETRDWKAYAEF